MNVILTTITLFREEEPFIKVSPKDEGGYPVGVTYIQSYLNSIGHHAEYLDFIHVPYNDSKKILLEKIEELHPTTIGFSAVTGNHINTLRMIEFIHSRYPNIRLIMGGIHITIMYEQIIKAYPYLIAVIGEGEITFSELLTDAPLSSIKGIAYFDEHVIKTENRPLIPNLDILPFPPHAGLTPEHELANILTSRGCPASCSFCVLNPNAKRIRRQRSAKNVVDEVEYVLKKHPYIKLIYFIDDAFLMDNNRAIEICKELIARNLTHVDYQCQARFKPFHAELIPYLEAANFKSIFFGLETANEGMLKACHKNITQQDVITTMTTLKQSKLKISMFLITGLPGETPSTIIETANFIRKVQRIKYIMYYENKFLPILMVYPGTEIYQIMKSAGKINDDYWMTTTSIPFFTAEHTFEELTTLRNQLARNVAFMPITLPKLIDQREFIIPVLKYIFQQYKSNPLQLIKNIIRG